MPTPAPIVLHLYDPETNELKETLIRSFLPWKMLKKAVRLQKELDGVEDGQYAEEQMDAVAQYIIELFGHDLTVEILDEQADTAEMQAVLQAIIARARGIMDPTLPPAAS